MQSIKSHLKLLVDEKIPLLAVLRRRKLKNTNFTVISNNCWAGNVYRYFGLPYLTPTVGIYFWAQDYLRFVSNLRYYLSQNIEFIDYTESKYRREIIAKNQCHIPIGRLDDIEIVFLHYKDEEEARNKWTKRAKRVNFDNILIKFSEMNNCAHSDLASFDNLKFENKFMFVKNKDHSFKSGIYLPNYDNWNNISNDTNKWNEHVDIFDLLNNRAGKYKL
ncbi:DUF1919 domain-containing protein [Natronincola ferrireducens]|uniref:Uncharacterized protein, DUF1919 family n=1 Tax=Natronincola ferrireducens TaxID=393762 RepID=A0A1G8X663_9FIRM|nr:DUF1919 domain-containing protein [Natronincola ferrireducens]SDJ86139.1 Uncharacterized protein, DUF1919 family [Natronincola ferrireducens]